MNNLSRVLLFAVILCGLGANWDMSGTKSRWSMVGSERSEPIIKPTLSPIQVIREYAAPRADPVPTIVPDLPASEEVNFTQPVTQTYLRRIRLFRWR